VVVAEELVAAPPDGFDTVCRPSDVVTASGVAVLVEQEECSCPIETTLIPNHEDISGVWVHGSHAQFLPSTMAFTPDSEMLNRLAIEYIDVPAARRRRISRTSASVNLEVLAAVPSITVPSRHMSAEFSALVAHLRWR